MQKILPLIVLIIFFSGIAKPTYDENITMEMQPTKHLYFPESGWMGFSLTSKQDSYHEYNKINCTMDLNIDTASRFWADHWHMEDKYYVVIYHVKHP